MRTLTILGLGLFAVACSSDITKAAAKAFDQNNSQPGEADSRAVVVTQSGPRNAAVTTDGTNLVYVQDNGDVFQVPADGNAAPAPQKLGTFPVGSTENTRDEAEVAVDTDFVWFASGDTGLVRMPRAGGAVEKLADTPNEASFVLVPDAVFFQSSTEKLSRFDKATKAIVDIATNFQNLGGIAFDATNKKIWICDRNANTISWVPSDSAAPATPTVAVSNQPSPASCAMGPDTVYWANGLLGGDQTLQNKVMGYKADGSGQPTVIATTNNDFPNPIMADSSFVYLGAIGGGVERAPVAGGTANATQFLQLTEADFVITDKFVFAVENNINRADEANRTAPNRVLAATK